GRPSVVLGTARWHPRSARRLALAAGRGAPRWLGGGIAEPLPEGAWPIISASPLPYFPYSAVPREMTPADMDQAIADYVAATKRGLRAGFDMVEMHAAHGYLLASFISPLTNVRSDAYGGSPDNPLLLPLEGVRAI